MTRVIVSEKTLEINVTAELLQLIRGFPGCQNAFWIGMKQRQEARNGIDDLIANVPRGLHMALQFKAPRPTPRNGDPFIFSLNARQHENLCRLAARRPDAVQYVFPQVNTFQALRIISPNLLQETIGVAVRDLLWLSPGPHRIESSAWGLSVFSERTPIPSKSIREVIQTVFESLRLDTDVDAVAVQSPLLTHSELQAWLEETFRIEEQNASAIGQRLRGFSTLCVPV